MRAAIGVLLMTLSGPVPHFFLHHQVDQGQSGLAQQVTDSFLQKTHDAGHGKDHLDVGVLFAGQLAELLYRPLLLDLVSSLHSDSLLFLGRKLPSAHYDRGVRVATFYELTGILLQAASLVIIGTCALAMSPPQPQQSISRDEARQQLQTPTFTYRVTVVSRSVQ